MANENRPRADPFYAARWSILGPAGRRRGGGCRAGSTWQIRREISGDCLAGFLVDRSVSEMGGAAGAECQLPTPKRARADLPVRLAWVWSLAPEADRPWCRDLIRRPLPPGPAVRRLRSLDAGGCSRRRPLCPAGMSRLQPAPMGCL